MDTPKFECELVALHPDGQRLMDQLKASLGPVIEQPNGLGMIMTALAQLDPRAIEQARMWLDNAETEDGSQMRSREIAELTGRHFILGSPRITSFG